MRVTLLLLLLLTGCAAPLSKTQSPAVLAETKALAAFARDGWHLPFKVTVFLPAGDEGEDLALEQLAELRRAYGDSPFDLYAAHVSVVTEGEPEVSLEADELRLDVKIPLGGAPLSAEALLEAVCEDYEWKRSARWYANEAEEDLVAALQRDLGKLCRLQDGLALDCRRLELLAATLQARAKGDEPPLLWPSEAEFARTAQYRATFAINRVLNTLARWRVAAEDSSFKRQREALTVAYHARLIHEVYLDWFLDVVVGGRTKLKIWKKDWWSRNSLYRALDTPAPLQGVGGKLGIPTLSGGIRTLLSLRLDFSLRGCFSDLDQAWNKQRSGSTDDALRSELAVTTSRLERLRSLGKEKHFDSFTAFKELWDARIKDTVKVPFYGLVKSVAEFLGDTRIRHPDPAVSTAQLAALESSLRPGDVILVRQELYLSNAFLPGFWPHALIYLGPTKDWTRLKLADGTPLSDDPVVRAALPEYAKSIEGDPARVIEAISEGVVFNSLERAVQKDYVVVFRPELAEAEVASAIRRALLFLGRPYDFDFDFATDDRIVCTELVYRAYDSQLKFSAGARDPQVPGVVAVMGRQTMPANDLARLVLYMARHPSPNPKTGYPGQRLRVVSLLDRTGPGTAEFLTGAAAKARLEESVKR
ncbi:MAG: hypothetical protein JKY65_23110 [Planctomycetes bacterium]|nr:hypothetical protein [Planctomycetota bacterium]